MPMLWEPSADPQYFVSPRSFSEVQNAKARLEGLSRRWLTELRHRREAVGLLSMRSRKGGEPDPESVTQALDDLEQAITEFQGTGCERFLLQDLFILLRNRGKGERWLRLYLGLLYEHPASELVRVLAPEALTIAKAEGRESEISEAFQHLANIPSEFGGKARIATVKAR